MPLDSETLAIFKTRAEMQGSFYQALMGEGLQQFVTIHIISTSTIG